MNSTFELGDDAARALKPYPAYKDSGIEWLGQVPVHWKLRHLGRIGRLFKGGGGTKEDEREDGIPCVRYGDLYTRHRFFITASRACVAPELAATAYTPIAYGDVLFAGSGETIEEIGKSAVNLIRGQACCGGDVIVFRPSIDAEARFLGYMADCSASVHQKACIGRGFTVMHIYSSDLKYMTVAIPPVPEQAAIARFLDHADRRIGRYIRAKQQLIDHLEEQKQAVIQEAVTGRIDVRTGQRYAAYRPSGVEWLGELPKQWTSTRLKVVLSRPIQNGIFKKKDQFGAGAPLINVADVYGEHFRVEPESLERVQVSADEVRRFQVQAGDLFFVRSSLKLEGTGRSAVATGCSSDTVFECHLVQARPDSGRINPRYLVFQLNSYAHRHHLISRANVVTMATVAQDTISSCPVVVPPRNEQDRIVEWIDAQRSRLSQVVEGANREISLLRKYRVRLIADGVTGKLDLREAAAETPDKSGGLNGGEGINAAEHCDAVEAG